jgi:hypothetical protein
MNYDPNWFNSYEEQVAYFKQKAIQDALIEERKAEKAFQYHKAGGNEPLDFDPAGNLLLYLWFRLHSNNPVDPPQAGLSGSQLRHSSRTTRPVVCLDNLYGNQAPVDTEQMTDIEFQRLMSGVPAPSGSSAHRDTLICASQSQSPQNKGKDKEHANYLARIKQEGGAGLIN